MLFEESLHVRLICEMPVSMEVEYVSSSISNSIVLSTLSFIVYCANMVSKEGFWFNWYVNDVDR